MRPRLLLLALFTLNFVLVYGSADLLTGLHPYRLPMHGLSWPFWPSTTFVYLSLNLLLGLAFLTLPKDRIASFSAAMFGQTFLAWPFFVLLPLPEIASPVAHPGTALQIADELNLHYNYFPSLHVAYALTCALFAGRWWVWLWSLTIAASTLMAHQHYAIDVLGGVALALLATWWAKGPGRVDALCFYEMARCTARHRRYGIIAFALLSASLGRWKRRRLARVGFCYLQRLDDILDGHLLTRREPLKIAQEQLDKGGGESAFGTGPLDELGAALQREWTDRGSDEGRAITRSVVEEMMIDRERVKDGRLLEEDELWIHLERTFENSMDLMLLAADSSLRSRQVPHLIRALAWCSIVRDLEEDLELGLVNFPQHVWEEERAVEWLTGLHEGVGRDLETAAREVGALEDEKGHGLLKLFLKSIHRYERAGTGGYSATIQRSRKVPASRTGE